MAMPTGRCATQPSIAFNFVVMCKVFIVFQIVGARAGFWNIGNINGWQDLSKHKYYKQLAYILLVGKEIYVLHAYPTEVLIYCVCDYGGVAAPLVNMAGNGVADVLLQ